MTPFPTYLTKSLAGLAVAAHPKSRYYVFMSDIKFKIIINPNICPYLQWLPKHHHGHSYIGVHKKYAFLNSGKWDPSLSP